MCLTLKYVLNSVHVHMTTGTLVLIRINMKADLLEIKFNGTKYRKVHADEINFDLGKNGCPCSLGSRSVVEFSQAGWQTIFLQFATFFNLSTLILKQI